MRGERAAPSTKKSSCRQIELNFRDFQRVQADPRSPQKNDRAMRGDSPFPAFHVTAVQAGRTTMSMSDAPNDQMKAAQDFATRTTEKAAAQTSATIDNVNSAAKSATEHFREAGVGSFQAACEYNAKLMEFAVANSKSSLGWTQKLAEMKSPTDFVAAISAHAREQFAVYAEQAKELSTLAAKVVPKAGEPK
jgi:hypothetical protein